jgi:predicted nucleic acid-binding protein
MRVYLDTSVLVAACLEGHPRHGEAFALLARLRSGEVEGVTGGHALAEFYSVVTRAPLSPRVHPAEAGRMVKDTLEDSLRVLALTAREYGEAIAEASEMGWRGGSIYDALHVRTAIKARCDRIYTFNVRDFQRLAGGDWKEKVAEPGGIW